MGAFRPAMEAASRADAIGSAIGGAVVRSYAGSVIAGVHMVSEDFDAAVTAGRRAFELAPNPFARAIVGGWLGIVYLESGDVAQALPLLERAAELMGQFRFQEQSWFITAAGECHARAGRPDQARELILRGLELARGMPYGLGVGRAQRALGHLVQAAGDLDAARGHFNDAVDSFASIEARYELARTHLALADLGALTGQAEMSASNLRTAYRLFVELDVAPSVSRAERLAQTAGISLRG